MRVQNRMIRILLGGVALASVLTMAGCGKDVTPPDEQRPKQFAGAPSWVLAGCSSYWDDDDEGIRLCGAGGAKIGQSMSIARTKATSRARA